MLTIRVDLNGMAKAALLGAHKSTSNRSALTPIYITAQVFGASHCGAGRPNVLANGMIASVIYDYYG